jgi:hypothetical protein
MYKIPRYCSPQTEREETNLLRRFAGCSGAKSRPRCGKRDAVNICGFQRRADFKRAFDARPARLAPNSGRICLDRHCHNAYNDRIKQERRAGNCGKAQVVRQFRVIILVGRRIAGGG